MEPAIDLILVNSFAPRHRIACDATLENGVAIMRTYLEDQGFGVHVVDDLRISSVEKGVAAWIRKALRALSRWQVASLGRGARLAAYAAYFLAHPLHSYSIACRRRYMNSLIDAVAARAARDNVPIVGIKVWNGEAYDWSARLAAAVTAASPETTVIAGGPHVKVYGEHIMDKREFDLAIMGPGEELLAHLLRMRREAADKAAFLAAVKREIPGAPFIRTGNYSDGGDYMFGAFVTPRYRTEDMADKILMHTLVDGLGCTWKRCSFCSHTRQTVPYRPRPAAEIAAEMAAMVRQGISFFRFSCSDTPVGQGKAIAAAILAARLKVNYSMFFRSIRAGEEACEAFRLMIRSGLKAVYIGGECGHDEILAKVMNKGMAAEQIVGTVRCIKRAAAAEGKPCQIALSLIYPCPLAPGVTLQEVFDADLRLVKETMPDTVIVNPPAVLPGTAWFDEKDRFGFRVDDDSVARMMRFEYSLYKPFEFAPWIWEMQDLDAKAILAETARLSRAVAALGIPLNMPDEFLMMTQAIGYRTVAELDEFKHRSQIDVMTGSAEYLRAVTAAMNGRGREMAGAGS